MEDKKVRKRAKKEKKVKKIIAPHAQTIFSLLSIMFIMTCCIYYGTRLVKYYKIYNPKTEAGERLSNLSTGIIANSQIVYEGDGLYINNGNYIYKGKDVNNYILINNMMFRIIRINSDKTIEVVLDEYLNKLKWDDKVVDYTKSSINKYLNDKFLDILDKDLLVPTNVCKNAISELTEVKCEEVDNSNYVKLLDVIDFLNSLNENKTYLVNDSEFLWLNNYTLDKVWHTSGVSINSSNPNKMYGIKPVITLKNSTILVGGDGSSNNPYQVNENDRKIKVGTYLDINDDIYIVYEIGDDYLKVESNKVLKSQQIFAKDTIDYANSSLKTYLEKTYLEDLNYQSLLKDVDFNGITSKIGLLSLDDFKFNSSLKNYYLSDTTDSEIYLYNGSLLTSKSNIKRNIRPCLGLEKNLKIISGNGSKLAPFIVEV